MEIQIRDKKIKSKNQVKIIDENRVEVISHSVWCIAVFWLHVL